jgi:hypothetical protein
VVRFEALSCLRPLPFRVRYSAFHLRVVFSAHLCMHTHETLSEHGAGGSRVAGNRASGGQLTPHPSGDASKTGGSMKVFSGRFTWDDVFAW